jgi:hypothetical protein
VLQYSMRHDSKLNIVCFYELYGFFQLRTLHCLQDTNLYYRSKHRPIAWHEKQPLRKFETRFPFLWKHNAWSKLATIINFLNTGAATDDLAWFRWVVIRKKIGKTNVHASFKWAVHPTLQIGMIEGRGSGPMWS